MRCDFLLLKNLKKISSLRTQKKRPKKGAFCLIKGKGELSSRPFLPLQVQGLLPHPMADL